MKRRLLRIFLVVLVVGAFTAYFAFTTFLYDPLEGAYAEDVASLVPRDVDFFAAKARLHDDFAEFPRLAIQEKLAATTAGRTFLDSDESKRLAAAVGLEEALAALRELLARLPIEIDPLDVVGGEDLAVAGYLRGVELEEADWAVYARVNWLGKLAVSLLRHPDLLELEAQGVSVAESEGCTTISSRDLPRPIHLVRIRDVVVAGTSQEQVRRALELEARKGEDSLLQSARYHDNIASARDRSGDELELYVDLRTLLERMGVAGTWPDARSEELVTALVGRMFQLGSVKEIVGVLGFEGGPRLALRGELSSEVISPVQKRLYREKGFDRGTLSQVARLAPADAIVFLYAHAELGDLVRAVRESLEPGYRDLIDDLARSVWSYPDSLRLVDDISAAFRDHIAFVARENDYVDDSLDAPLHDDTPVLAWGLVLWVETPEKVEELRNKVVRNYAQFGIRGRQEGSTGVFTNVVEGGYRIYEYHQPLVPGTGHLSTVEEADFFILSNSHLLLEDMLNALRRGGARHPPLSEQPNFQQMVGFGLPNASLAAWYNPVAAKKAMRDLARFRARNEVFIDWSQERPRIEQLVLAERFSGQAKRVLSAEQLEELVGLVDERCGEFEREYKDERTAAGYAVYDRALTYSELARAALLEVALDPKQIELFARALVPLE